MKIITRDALYVEVCNTQRHNVLKFILNPISKKYKKNTVKQAKKYKRENMYIEVNL